MSLTSAEDYLNKNIRPIIEALAEAVIQDEPEDPVSIINNQINYLYFTVVFTSMLS